MNHDRSTRCHSGCVLLPLLTYLAAFGWSSGVRADKPAAAEEEHDAPTIDVSATLGFGFMRGGTGGLTAAQRAPLAIDVQVMAVKDDTWLLGGALRVELEDAKAVAGIARVALRHTSGALELRPGAGLPFYLGPRTMLGPEVNLGFRYALSDIMGLQGMAAISAYLFGNDVPVGSTVVMMHVFLGVGFLL